MSGWIIFVLFIWTALGFVVWAFIKAGGDYRRPITEADIKTLADEADRVVRLGDQHPWMEGR